MSATIPAQPTSLGVHNAVRPERTKRATAIRVPKITQSDLNRVVSLAKSLGLRFAEIEVTPTRVRLITDAGRNLTATDDQESLDRELAEFRGRHGNGAS